MINPFRSKTFCALSIVFLFLIVANMMLKERQVVENIPSAMGSPGIQMGTLPDTEQSWSNLGSHKPALLKKMNCDRSQYEFFDNNIEVIDTLEQKDDKELSYEDYLKNYDNRDEFYETDTYPRPYNNRPDLSQCVPCKPCKDRTIIVHKMSPKLMGKIKEKLGL